MARHGLTHGKAKTRVYKSWQSMKQRCSNPRDPSYPRYGGKGISYPIEWESFENFYADVGDRPEGTSLDRRNNEESYTKDNCRWATPKQQTRNRTDNNFVTFKGETKCMLDWCKYLGIARTTLGNRLNRGWGVEKAFTTPVRKRYGK